MKDGMDETTQMTNYVLYTILHVKSYGKLSHKRTRDVDGKITLIYT
jgi:hypothetical protein